MGWQLLRFTAWFDKSSVHDQPWWIGWKPAGLSRWLINLIEHPSSSVHRVEQDGWVDFFFGKAGMAGSEVHSVLEGEAKVGLHYCVEDAYDLFDLDCPSPEIPPHLWRLFKQEMLAQTLVVF